MKGGHARAPTSGEVERDRNYDRATDGDDTIGAPTSGGGRGIDQLTAGITGSPMDDDGDSLVDIEDEDEEKKEKKGERA